MTNKVDDELYEDVKRVQKLWVLFNPDFTDPENSLRKCHQLCQEQAKVIGKMLGAVEFKNDMLNIYKDE